MHAWALRGADADADPDTDRHHRERLGEMPPPVRHPISAEETVRLVE